jgi:hypothetical protein
VGSRGLLCGWYTGCGMRGIGAWSAVGGAESGSWAACRRSGTGSSEGAGVVASGLGGGACACSFVACCGTVGGVGILILDWHSVGSCGAAWCLSCSVDEFLSTCSGSARGGDARWLGMSMLSILRERFSAILVREAIADTALRFGSLISCGAGWTLLSSAWIRSFTL